MSLSLGISHLALPNPPAGTTTPQSGRSSFSSQRWKLNNVRSVSLRVRPNPRGRSSGQVHEAEAGERVFGRKGLSAEYAADGGEFSEEGFVPHDPVGYRGGAAGRSAAPQRSDGKFWRRFPGFPQGGNRDVIVPIDALRKGAVFRGTVSSVQSFGAFVSFGAFADGLIHISKLGTGFVKNVSDLVELGQEVMVSIVNVEESTGRISLSLMEQDQVDLRKPYVAHGLEEARHRREMPHFQSRSGRSALSLGAREERVSNGSYASSSRSMDSREGGGWSRYQPGSGRISHPTPEEEQERYSSDRNAYSKQRGARREGEGPRFQPGSGRRSPYVVEEEDHITWNPFASTRLGEAGEGDIGSKNPFASPRTGQSKGEDRRSRNPFASSRQGEAGEGDIGSKDPFASPRTGQSKGEDRRSRNPFASSRQGEAGEGDIGSKDPFASPRTGQSRGEDRRSRNPFASSRQGEAGEGDIGSKNPFASPRTGQSRGEDRRSRNPFASSRQGEAGEGDIGLKNPFSSPGTRQPRGEDRQSRNPFASSRQGEAGEGDRVAKNRFASPRKGQSGGEDRQSRNLFASSRQWEAREEVRTSRNPSGPSRRREAGEEGTNTRFKYQRNDGNFKSRGRLSRVGNGADREEQMKPRMKLVHIQSDVKSEEDKVSSRMRNVMSSWYECDCC